MNLFRLRGKPLNVVVGENGETISIPLFTFDDFRDLSVKLQAQNMRAMAGATDEQLGIDKKKGKDNPDPNAVLKLRLLLEFREPTEEEIRRHILTIDGSLHVVTTCLNKIEGWDKAKSDEFAKSIRHDERTTLAWLLCGYDQLPEKLAENTPTAADKATKEVKSAKK